MTISLKHAFTSAIPVDTEAQARGEVTPDNWNAEHTLTMGSGRLLGRSTSGGGVVEEIALSGKFSLTAGVLDVAAAALANPTGNVGLTAVDGSALTAMRSDAAPALDQSISPSMTGNWTFNPGNSATPLTFTVSPAVFLNTIGASPALLFNTVGALVAGTYPDTLYGNKVPGLDLRNTVSGGDITIKNYAILNNISVFDHVDQLANHLLIDGKIYSDAVGGRIGVHISLDLLETPLVYPPPGDNEAYSALVAEAIGTANVDPTKSLGLWGANIITSVFGTGYELSFGVEVNSQIITGGSLLVRVGFQATASGDLAGTDGRDTAFSIFTQATKPAWNRGFWAFDGSMDSNGTIFGAGTVTALYGVDLNAATFTAGGFAFRSPGFSVDPSGNLAAKTTTITSNSANALVVGPNGATNPVFRIDGSVVSQANGILLTGNAAGAGVSLGIISSATNDALYVDAKGTGPITLGNSSTGPIVLSRAMTYGGVLLDNSVVGTGPMVLGTNAVLTTPNLGTPSAVVLTNATGTAAGLTAGNVTTNANLTGDVASVGNATTFAHPPAQIVLKATGVDFNSGNTDTAITVTLPAGYTRYALNSVRISNASHSLTTATVGVFTSTGGGGAVIVAAGSAVTVSSTSDGTNNNAQALTIASTASGATTSFSVAGFPTLYFRIATAEGAAATADVTIGLVALP